jgi:SAM-dependent methyltransferase
LKVIQWRRKAGLPVRSVLDLGCGNGRNLRAFQIGTDATKLVGFDMCTKQARALCAARKSRPVYPPAVRFSEGHLGLDELPKGKFDIILLNYSLMFLTSYEVCNVARQVSERLAPGGWCVVEMYPAKDSECRSDEGCNKRMYEFVFATDVVVWASYGLRNIVRKSKNRMVIQKEAR